MEGETIRVCQECIASRRRCKGRKKAMRILSALYVLPDVNLANALEILESEKLSDEGISRRRIREPEVLKISAGTHRGRVGTLHMTARDGVRGEAPSHA